MISLLKSVTDLDRLTELQRTTLECYTGAISSTAEFAVAADKGEAEEFRKNLQALEKQLRGADGSPAVAKQVDAAFRDKLRDYQDKAQKKIDQLHQDVGAAAAAMKAFAESVSSNSDDHEKQLQGELTNLKTLTRSEDLKEIKGGIQNSTSNIEASFEQLRRSNQLVIAALQDEIRLLHQAIQTEKKSALTDRQTGVWNHTKMADRIEELARQNDAFSVMVVRIGNLNRLKARHSGPMVEAAVKMVLSRFQQMFGTDALVGRWSDDEFAAILSVPPSNTVAFSKEVSQKLSGDYPVMELGVTHNLAVQVTSGMLDRRAGDDLNQFKTNLEKMAEALAKD